MDGCGSGGAGVMGLVGAGFWVGGWVRVFGGGCVGRWVGGWMD